MAEVVSYPIPHCIRCWKDDPQFGVLDGGKVLGPYCQACADKKATELNDYQSAVEVALR